MRTKNKTAVALFCFLLAAFAVCDAKESSDPTISAVPSHYPIIDSGVWADWQPTTRSEISWIDNNRVIFKTVKDNDKRKIGEGPFNLSVFDVAANKVTPYSDFARKVDVCSSDGFIYYTLQDEKKNVKHFSGEFGKEKLFILPAGKSVNPLDCQIISDGVAERKKTRAIGMLKTKHGFLDRGPLKGWERNIAPVVFYRPGVSKGMELSIPASQTYKIQYYPFKDAYLVQDLNYGGGTKNEKFWWLYPDGKLEEGSIPAVHFYPTRTGIVVERGIAKSNRDSGTLGLYLWNGKDYVKLIGGKSVHITVSPDGCKLAFVHYLYSDATLIKDPGRITLKAINLCVEEN